MRQQAEGYTLNLPCGKSLVGNVRADIDPQFRPDVVCDLRRPPFKPGSFDTVICDPPFSLYNRFAWAWTIIRLARRKAMFSCPPVRMNFGKRWEKEWWIIEGWKGWTGARYVRMWQVFRSHLKPLDAINTN